MTMDTIAAQILQHTRQVLPPGAAAITVTLQSRLRDELGIDSLGLISLMFLVEEGLSVDMQPHAASIASCQTVGEIAEVTLQAVRAGLTDVETVS